MTEAGRLIAGRQDGKKSKPMGRMPLGLQSWISQHPGPEALEVEALRVRHFEIKYPRWSRMVRYDASVNANIRFVGRDALACTKHKSIWLMSHLARHKGQEHRVLDDWINLLSSLGFRDTSITHYQHCCLHLQPASGCQVSCGGAPRKCVAIEQQVGGGHFRFSAWPIQLGSAYLQACSCDGMVWKSSVWISFAGSPSQRPTPPTNFEPLMLIVPCFLPIGWPCAGIPQLP